MEKEDPLERLERQEREKKERKNSTAGSLRIVMWVMAAVAAALAVALFLTWNSQHKLVGELTQEKQDLTEQIEALQSDYESLSSEYDLINSQLDSSREQIAQLVDRVKKTDATNRAKIRQYEKELGTLRSIMRNYIVQIDSLNNLNHQLTIDAANARKEAAQQKQKNQELTTQVESLTGQVAAGSVIKARGIRVEAYSAADKVVDKSTRAVRLLVSLSLIENDLAPHGPMRIFVKVTGPDGERIPEADASREVDYEGAEVDLTIYINNIPAFTKGVYTVEVSTAENYLGKAETLLR